MKTVSLKVLKTIPTIAGWVFALSACGVKISSTDVRLCPKHKVSGPGKESFLKVMPAGRIIREDSVPEYNEMLELVRDMSNEGKGLSPNAVHLYVEERTPRKHGRGMGYKRAINVQELFSITDKQVTPLESHEDLRFLAGHPLLLPAVCDMLNAASPNYQTFVVYGQHANTIEKKYFVGIYVNVAAKDRRRILTTDDDATLPAPGYVNDAIPSIPPGNAGDSLLVSVPEKGDPGWWRPVPEKSAGPAAQAVAAQEDSLAIDSFRYVCDKNNDFSVMLYRDKQGEIKAISVTNAGDSVRVLYSHLFVAPQDSFAANGIKVKLSRGKLPGQYDSVTAVGTLAPGHSDTLFHGALGNPLLIPTPSVYDTIRMELRPKGGGVKIRDSVLIQLSAVPAHVYPYDRLFNQGSFMRWLKIYYPGISDLCVGDLAFQIQLRDSNYIKCIYCKVAAVAKDTSKAVKAADSVKTKSSGKVRAGYVQILPSEPLVMVPQFTGSSDTLPMHIKIPLLVNGQYDSTANKVQFVLKFGHVLSNHLKLTDTAVYLTRAQWDSARARGGRLNVWLTAQYSRNKDTLITPQEDYVVIKDSIQLGWKTIQLRNYNPSLPFWLELGTNFDLLNQLKVQNLYAGIVLFDKDATRFSLPALGVRNVNVSYIAGIYESLTGSTSATSNTVAYRDNSSFVRSGANGWPVYTDTGTVTVTTNTKNIGLFFEPCLRLTDIPADHNGVHVFASFYNEVLWQTVSTSYDYSKAAPNGLTTYVTDSNKLIGNYYYKIASNTVDYRSSYIGLGFPIYVKQKEFDFYLNPVLGISNQAFTPIRAIDSNDISILKSVYKTNSTTFTSGLPITYLSPKHSWNVFYLAQFRFNEAKYDISITGEVRTLLLRRGTPLISLTLSKKFDLGKILTGILSPIEAQ